MISQLRVAGSTVVRRVRSLSPEQWFWIGMGLVLVLYVFLLLTQPTAAGRGGR